MSSNRNETIHDNRNHNNNENNTYHYFYHYHSNTNFMMWYIAPKFWYLRAPVADGSSTILVKAPDLHFFGSLVLNRLSKNLLPDYRRRCMEALQPQAGIHPQHSGYHCQQINYQLQTGRVQEASVLHVAGFSSGA